MRSFISSLLALSIIIMGFSSNIMAKAPIRVIVNGKQLNLSKQPVMEMGTTLVPLRDIFESFGVNPGWNEKTQVITAQNGSINLWLQINNKKARIGEQEVTLNVPAKTLDGTTFVPLRFIAEAFGVNTKWNSVINTIFIGEGSGELIIDKSNIESFFNLTYGEVKRAYGRGANEGYYNGGRFISADELSLFFLFSDIEESDTRAKLVGLMADGSTSLFGIREGMSTREVKQILGTPDSEGEDVSGEGYAWYLFYKIGKYSCWINSQGETEPVQSITVLLK